MVDSLRIEGSSLINPFVLATDPRPALESESVNLGPLWHLLISDLYLERPDRILQELIMELGLGKESVIVEAPKPASGPFT